MTKELLFEMYGPITEDDWPGFQRSVDSLLASRDVRIEELEAACRVAKEALVGIEPFLPKLDSGPIRYSAHAQCSQLVWDAISSLSKVIP